MTQLSLQPNDWKPTQVLKYEDQEYPIYDLDQVRQFELYSDPTPPEIPLQVEANLKRVSGRVSRAFIENPELVAIVGYGPTLKASWENLRGFKTIFSTSGAHKFLVDRDIIPTYHVEGDFRPHKAMHTKESHPDVEYLLASSIHSNVLDNVEGKRVKLWHMGFPGIDYPKEDVTIPGCWDIGQGAIQVAKAMGYRNMHLFGFDYAFEMNGSTHAGPHNGEQRNLCFAKVDTRLYQTSDALARGVLSFTQLMRDNPDLTLGIHGDGLLAQYLNKHYV